MVERATEPPVFCIRGTDRFAIKAMDDYRRQCLAHGLREQADEVLKAIEEMSEWQYANRARVHLPDHKHVPQSDPHSMHPGFETWEDAIRRLRRLPANATPQMAADMLHNLATQQTEGKDESPHSRACGMRIHPHGNTCARDCPTCGTSGATATVINVPGVDEFLSHPETGAVSRRPERSEYMVEWPAVGEPVTGDIPPNE